MRILVVEDSRFMARQLAQKLATIGHEVVEIAADGNEGLAAYKRCAPDAVLLDITMPNRDGRDCLVDILDHDPAARVIMLSAIDDGEVVEDCLDHGAIGYLTKPPHFDDPETLATFQSWLGMS